MDKRLVLGLMALLLATALIYAATPYKNPYQFSTLRSTRRFGVKSPPLPTTT